MADTQSKIALSEESPFIVSEWRVDPPALRIDNGSKTVKLEPKAMAVLCYLAARPGVVATRQELEATVWAGSVVGYDALSNVVIKLRRAFGDSARKPRFIETIAKAGYRLIAEVSRPERNDSGSVPGRDTEGDAPTPGLTRKLAAILYADVVDYTRLSSENEDETHKRLSEYLDLFAALAGQHGGKIMHYAGDAVLAMFGAAIDAVSCAREVQLQIAERNRRGRRLQFRIGINLGDVFEDRGDVYGDGVNLAARLEGLAEAGGIVISEAILAAIGKSSAARFKFIGEKKLKNIADPVRAYAAILDEDDRPIPPRVPDKPAIAILPFENMSEDPRQDYFSDGISEDITTDLSKYPELMVIARNSAFVYRGSRVGVAQIGRELGVRFVLEGSVRRSGNRVRINAQLIDAESDGHVWAERYDRELTDLFEVQDEVTQAIVAALVPTLTADFEDESPSRDQRNLEAYDYFLRGREQSLLDTASANAMARELLEKAIAIDPTFSDAYAHLGRCHAVAYVNSWGDASRRSLETGLEMGRKAVALDENNPMAHFTVGVTAFWLNRNRLALKEISKAIEIDPNFAEGHGALGMVQVYSGEPAQALASLRTTMRLDPHYRDIYLHLTAQAHFHLGDYDEAVHALQRRLVRKPDSDISRVLLASAYGHLGEYDNSRAQWQAALDANPDYSIEKKRQMLPYQDPADFDLILDGLRKAGIIAGD